MLASRARDELIRRVTCPAAAATGQSRVVRFLARMRILRVALAEFAARGYHTTSVREIAERVGVTKTAVLHHFPSKADILGALAEPMLNDLDAAMVAADVADPVEARWAAIVGMLEAWLTHRYLPRMSLHDLAPAASGRVSNASVMP